ncbi:MAG: hypothetical protein ABWX73_11395 [Marmoricola sp.]
MSAALLPDGDSHLSDGVVIQTRLKARLFGIPALRVEGTVLVSPGKLVEPARSRQVTTVAGATAAPASRTSSASRGSNRSGADLARAAELLAANQAVLERSRLG